jgi:hypothetical protein
LGGASVTFVPELDDIEIAPRSLAVTAADGSYELICQDDSPGAVVGLHRIAIAIPPGRTARTPAGQAVALPAKYASPDDSDLEREVQPGQNTLDFDLSGQR